MDVPPPNEDEDEGADLSLESADDDIRQALRRGRDEMEEEEAAIERVVDAVHEMRKLKRRHTAPHRLPIEETEKSHRLLPREVDVSLEKAMISPLLYAMQVSDALRLAKALRSVRSLLWTDDDMWAHWWHRDFPDVRRDLGQTGPLPPSWIIDNIWIDALPGVEPRYLPPMLTRLALMPWRRWYQWSEFFRRSALWHIAKMQNKIAEDWLDVNPENPEDDETGYPRPATVLESGKVINLRVPRFDEVTGIAHGLVLVDTNQQVYFPWELYENDDALTLVPTPTSVVIAGAQSPVFWFLHYAEREMRSAYGERTGHGTYGAAIQRKWKSIMEGQRFKELLDERLISADLLLGGTTEMAMGPEALNFDYAKVFELYCAWYARSVNAEGFNPYFSPGNGFAFLLTKEEAQVTTELARTLPPFPAIGNVWFVGQGIQPSQIAVSITKSTPICGGCDTQTAHRIRCKNCGHGYCGQACHERNWRRNCQGCVKGRK